jgi:large-conductance mechanosensitive channel
MASENENQIEEERRQASIDRVGILNEQRQQAVITRDQQKLEAIRAEEKMFKDMQPNAVNKGTSNLLKAAWENLIDSFGATLLWIDIHIFSGMVMGNKLFCKLGMEWVPDIIKQTRFKEAEKMGNRIGFFEGVGVAGLNFGCLLVLIINLMIVAMMIKVVTNPIDFYSGLIGFYWDSAKNFIVGG